MGFNFWGEQFPPDRQWPTHTQGPWNIGLFVRLLNRFHALHEVRVERLHVGRADTCIGRKWHGGIQAAATLANPMAHSLVEVIKAVAANSAGVRGDVGRIHRADWRLHAKSAGEGFATLGGMTGDAVTGTRQVFSLFDLGIGGLCSPCREVRAKHQRRDKYFFHHVSLLMPGPAGRGSSGTVRESPVPTSTSGLRQGR
ncbi:hypothetical protein D3C75_933760 [compost metagenome]